MWESGNVPVYLATRVSLRYLFVSIIVHRSDFLLDAFGMLLHSGFILQLKSVKLLF